MVINRIIRYGDVGMPPNKFDGKTTQFPTGIENNRKSPSLQTFVIPLGIWFALPMNSFIGASIPDLTVNLYPSSAYLIGALILNFALPFG